MGILDIFLNKKPIGEQSAMREEESILTIDTINYNIDTTIVNYQLARELYNNTHNNYKLGAHFVKPVVNSFSSFIGTPDFVSEDGTATFVINKYIEENKSVFQKAIKEMLREGDSYVYVYYDLLDNKLFKNELKIKAKTLLQENTKLVKNINDEIEKAILVNYIDNIDENGNNIKFKIIEIWTNETYSISYDDIDVPANYDFDFTPQSNINVLGFIPIVHFKNENENHRNYGTSEIEAIEPFLRAYHETMYNYLRASKINSSPILILKVNNKQQFLKNNFTAEERATKKVKIIRKDMLFLEGEESADYLEIQAKSYSDLLEYLYYCIVDVSEIPEFIFGTAVSSSKASVSEQMPAFIKKIEKKREEVEENFKLIARMFFSIYNDFDITNEGTINLFETTLSWKAIDEEDVNQKTEAITTLINGLIVAVEGKLISYESAINYLSKYVDTMKDYEEEKEDILNQLEDMGDNYESELETQLNSLRQLNLNQNVENNQNTDQTNSNDENISEEQQTA